MKTTGCRSLLSCILLFSLHANAQVTTGSLRALTETNLLTDADALLAGRAGQWRVKERNAHQTEWYSVRYRTNAGTGKVTASTNSYIELATGLNRFEAASGKWVESKEEIEIVPGGAVARKGQHQVAFAANINTAGAIQTTGPDGKVLRSHVLGLAYTDAATGESVLIAELRDSIGEVIGNQVIYRDAFDGPFRADLRYTYTKAGFEQDVIFRESPPVPEKFGLNSETARLEVWTEFLSPPTPVKTVSVLKVETNDLVRSVMVDPDMTDESLDFGAMRIGTGTAFSLEEGAHGLDNPAIPVGKDWLRLEGRDFLIEKIDFEDAQPLLQELPAARVNGVKQAALPAKRRTALLASHKGPTMDQDRAQATAKPMRTASVASPERGFVLDYLLDLNQIYGNPGSAANLTLKSDTTYYVSGVVNLTGTTTIEGGTVVKYASGTTAYLNVQGPLFCQTEPYRPAFFTAKDDNSVGEIISGSTGVPSGYYGQYSLRLSSGTQTYSLRHLRVRHGYYGIFRILGSASTPFTIEHTQVQNCNRAVSSSSAALFMRNVLIYRCESGVFSSLSIPAVGENITFHRLGALQSSPSLPALKLTNSLVISCTNYLNYAPESSVHYFLDDAGIFQPGGTAEHYLAALSPYRQVGKVTGNSSFLGSLTNTTTYPPQTLSGTIGQSVVLEPVVSRNSKTAPDIGYAYDVVDFLANNLVVQGTMSPPVTLTLANGVIVAVNPLAGLNGIEFGNYSELVSVGQPGLLNRILPIQMVQENANLANSWPSQFKLLHGAGLGNYPNAFLRFSDISVPSGPYHVMGYWSGGFIKLAFQDSQVRGGTLYLGSDSSSQSIGLTNTYWERVAYWHHPYAAAHFDARNNLFKGGSLNIDMNPVGSPAWTFSDNLFDGTVISQVGGPSVQNSFNAYVHTAQNTSRLSPSPGSGDVILTASPTYAAGPFGSNYLHGSPTALVDKGSRTAGAAGLMHYTTSASLVTTEGDTMVDIGLHYPSLAADGKFLDSDGDGIVNIIEDPNGNGSMDAGETHYADTDSDYDGRSDWQELFEDFTDPRDSADGKQVQLGHWKFESTAWLGENGQIPLAASATLGNPEAWSGKVLSVDGTAAANLKYRDTEVGGPANINLRRGTVSFWFQPNWASSSVGNGTGPGQVARLMESGNTVNIADGWWAISISASGEHLLFESQIGGPASRVIYLSHPISWVARHWHKVTVAYSQTETKLYVDGQLAASGVGIQSYPTSAARGADGFSIGSNRSGGERSEGQFDELETYNYVLTAEQIAASYAATMLRDQDHDGLADVRENSFGTDPTNPDSDNDRLLDGEEVDTFQTSPHLVDTDYDGRSDWQEIQPEESTSPIAAFSVFQTNLAYFPFDSDLFAGAQGQQPKVNYGVNTVDSWNGKALSITGSGTARLAYSDIEADTSANINLREGTIQFWFKPNWSSGTGPGHVVRLIEVGDPNDPEAGWWSLSINSTGDSVRFEAVTNGVTQPHVFFEAPCPYVFFAGEWVMVTLSYDQSFSALHINEWMHSLLSLPVDIYPGPAGRSVNGFSIGSNRNGGERAEGQIEDLKTYNYAFYDEPNGPTPILDAYYERALKLPSEFRVRVPRFVKRTSLPPASPQSTVAVSVDGSPYGEMMYGMGTAFAPPLQPSSWQPAQSFDVSLPAPGDYFIWIKFRNGTETGGWMRYPVTFDDTNPQLVSLMNPQTLAFGPVPSGPLTISRPLIQLIGNASEQLSKVSYHVYYVGNSLSTAETPGYILKEEFSASIPQPEQPEHLSSLFQCFDIELQDDGNVVFVTLVDLAGNETVTQVTYNLDIDGGAAPTFLSQWPIPGSKLAGNQVTIRGYLDDPTARIRADFTVNGQAQSIAGVVERDGLFWIENVPIAEGPNSLEIVAENVAGQDTTTDPFEVIGETVSMALEIDSIDYQLGKADVRFPQSIPGFVVYVNGVEIPNPGSANATPVPINEGGTTTFHVSAYPNGQVPLIQAAGGQGATLDNVTSPNPYTIEAIHYALDVGRDPLIFASLYSGSASHWTDTWDPCACGMELHNDLWSSVWALGVGGVHYNKNWAQGCGGNPTVSEITTTWDALGNASSASGQQSYLPQVPIYPWEHASGAFLDSSTCGGTSSSCPPCMGLYTRRSAQTRVTLFTGGKSIAKGTRLFTISGSAWENCVLWLGLPDVCPVEALQRSINPMQIQIPGLGGKYLDNYSRVHDVLPNGVRIDVTPKIEGENNYQFELSPTRWADWDIDVDSDNTAPLAGPQRTQQEEDVEDVDGQPGKIIMANREDRDEDGVPGFADGFGDINGNDYGEPGSVASVPMVLEFHSPIDLKKATIKFSYAASDPNSVTLDQDGFEAAPGKLRLWMRPVSEWRSALLPDEGGDYIAPDEPYSLEYFGVSGNDSVIQVYVEGIDASGGAGDARIVVTFDPDGDDGPLPSVGTPDPKAVRLTVIDTEIVEALDNGSVVVREKVKESHSAPWFDSLSVTILQTYPSADGSKLMANVSVVGSLKSRLSDMVPFEAGTITTANFTVNGGDTIPIPVQASKLNPDVIFAAAAGPSDLTRPYPYSGNINWQGTVEISTGENWFRVEATDNVPSSGLTGFAEFTAKIAAVASIGSNPPPSGQPAGPFHHFAYTTQPVTPLGTAWSGPGELHPYFVRMKGPQPVLNYMAGRPGMRIVPSGGNGYFVADQYLSPAPIVAAATAPKRESAFRATGQFALGFAKGFVYEGVDVVVGTAKFVWDGVTLISAAVVMNVNEDSEWATQRLIKFDTDATQFRQMASTMFDFVVKVQASQWQTLEAAAMGEWELANEKSKPVRDAILVGFEIVKSVAEKFKNADAFDRGEALGRLTLEIVSTVVPASKLGAVNKLEMLNKIKASPRLAKYRDIKEAVEAGVAVYTKLPEFCFVAGTLVITEHGVKAIETIQTGDRVLARDEIYGHQTYKPVVATVVTHPDRLYHLTYQTSQSFAPSASFAPPNDDQNVGGGDGFGAGSQDDELNISPLLMAGLFANRPVAPRPAAELICSGPHPFYVKSLKRFVPAQELVPGQEFLLMDGRDAVLEAVTVEEAPAGETFTTYNFEVADYHTYFVGTEGVWVHNSGAPKAAFCKVITTEIRTKLNAAGTKPWQVFQDTIIQMAKAEDGHVGDATKKMVDWILDAHKKGELALQDIPTYKKVKEFLSSKKGVHSGVEGIPTPILDDTGGEVLTILKFGMDKWEGHHVIPKYIQKRLEFLLTGQNGQWDLDDVAVALVKREEHWYPNGVHARITGNGLHWGSAINGFNDAGEIIRRLALAYEPVRPDLAQVVRSWATSKGIAF